MVIFRCSVLQSMTSDMVLNKTLKLNNKDIIGCGGYGTVYKLQIDETTAFAVKRLNKGTADRERGFERELEAMADIKHRNIVTLHGYYTSPHYNLLIYELMSNGSLDSFLHGTHHLVLIPYFLHDALTGVPSHNWLDSFYFFLVQFLDTHTHTHTHTHTLQFFL